MIQSSPDLSINAGNSRAQCLSKLGRCLVKEGKFLEGKEKIQQAIDIRQRLGDEDIVMLGATYNDMAGTCHLLCMSLRFQRGTATENSFLRQHSRMTSAKNVTRTNRIRIVTHQQWDARPCLVQFNSEFYLTTDSISALFLSQLYLLPLFSRTVAGNEALYRAQFLFSFNVLNWKTPRQRNNNIFL